MSAPLAALHHVREVRDESIEVVGSLLTDLRDVIELLPLNCYRAQPAARVSGSVGAHVRHALDHVRALVSALDGDELRYDHRPRGTTVEVDPLSGVNEIERLLHRIDRLDPGALDAPVTFSMLLDPARPAVVVPTTLARELAFVIQHTIHHCALIAMLLDWQGRRVPYGFGIAPSTRRTHALAG